LCTGGGGDDDGRLVDCSADEMEDAGHTAEAPPPCCGNNGQPESNAGDDAEQVGRGDGAMEEAGHIAVVPPPFVDTGDLFGRHERTTTDGGAWHLGPVYGPCGP